MFLRIRAGILLVFLTLGLIFGSQLLVSQIPAKKIDLINNQLEFKTETSVVSSPTHRPINFEQARVKKIVDGDTILLTDGRVVRYIGIDTPETVHPNKPVECFGPQASQANKNLVLNQTVWLEKDVSETDRYQRLLRYVYLSDPTSTNSANSVMVNARLITDGYAYASSFPPDIKYQTLFRELENQARESNQGLWGLADCAKK